MHANKIPRILLWNAQSITNKTKQTQLEYFVMKNKIDIILLVETFLKPEHIFQIDNFIVYRNDRLNRAHGGVAIAIRNSLKHKHCSPIDTQSIENIAIEILIGNTPTNIVVAYCPKHFTQFENDIQMLTSTANQFMIFGDFNAKHQAWNCVKNNKSGNQLYALQQTNNFMIYNSTEHTHFPHSGQTPSTIDILLANVTFEFQLSSYAGCLFSDHNPVICDIDEFMQQSIKKKYDYKKADWSQYRRLIESKIETIAQPESASEIDIAIDSFTKLILDSQSLCIPIKSNST